MGKLLVLFLKQSFQWLESINRMEWIEVPVFYTHTQSYKICYKILNIEFYNDYGEELLQVLTTYLFGLLGVGSPVGRF